MPTPKPRAPSPLRAKAIEKKSTPAEPAPRRREKAVATIARAAKAAPKNLPKPVPAGTTGPLVVGAPAPPFTLAGDDGRTHSLAEHLGHRVVVYFYPRDETPGCTLEAHQFRDARAAFAARKTVVFGVSRDSIASHCRFRDKHGLDFRLLSDPDAVTLAAYGAWGEKSLYGRAVTGIIRTTVIVDAAGNVARVFARVKVKDHVQAVLAALDA